jgi:transposase
MTGQRKELNFEGQNIYIGLDVHKKSWSVTILSDVLVLKKYSQDPSPDVLYAHLVRNYPGATYYSVYEAGFCGFWIHYRLTELGIHNIVVNPADVPTTAGEKIRKTDAIDSNKLARSLRSGDLKAIYVPDNVSLEIRSLIRLKDSMTKDQIRQKNRIRSFLFLHGIEEPTFSTSHWSSRFITWLKEVSMKTTCGREALDIMINQLETLRKQRLELLARLRTLYKSDRFAEPLRLIMSVPGIGQLTGMALIAEIDDIKRFKSADNLASYIGMIPMCHASGDHEGIGDITIRKHSKLRPLLIEAAWTAARQDPAMQFAYAAYCKRMKPQMAIVKVARKLVNRIYYVMKHEQEYVNSIVA